MSARDALRRIIGHLERRGIAYMVVGSFASGYFGPSRTTYDIDIVIEAAADQLKELIADLKGDFYYAELDAALDALRQQSMFNVIDTAIAWKVDLIFRKARAFDQEEFGRRQPGRLLDIQLFIASAEDVIISKLEWSKLGGSQRQIEDVAKVLSLNWATLDQAYLSKWIRELQLEEQWSAAKQAAEVSE